MKKTLFFAIVLVSGLLFGGSGLALAQSHDYDFVVDQSRSSLTLYAYADLGFPFGDDDDSFTSEVTGTVKATLTPPCGSFTNIHVTDLQLWLVDDPHLSLFSGAITLDGSNIGLLMGEGDGVNPPYGSAGPATTVSGGNFNQTGNQIQGTGTITYDAGTFGSDTIDLAAEDPFDADFEGTVFDDGTLVTVGIPIDLFFYLDETNPGLGYATIAGTIVATAPTVPEPTSIMLLAGGCIALIARRRNRR